MMCKNFKLRRCDNGTFCFSRLRCKTNFKRFLPGKNFLTRADKHLRSDQELCLPSAREVLQPIYVTEITRNFPSEILMPFASARDELDEIKFFGNGNHDKYLLRESDISADSEENVISEIFAWVYRMEITEEDFSDGLSATTSVCEKWFSQKKKLENNSTNCCNFTNLEEYCQRLAGAVIAGQIIILHLKAVSVSLEVVNKIRLIRE